ncbi:hypothetical protein ACWGSK_26025 [Nocardiopsis sp. NPDC055551]
MSVGPNPYPPSPLAPPPSPSASPPYRSVRRATAWVLYAAIALTTLFALFHLARGTLALLHSVWFTLVT